MRSPRAQKRRWESVTFWDGVAAAYLQVAEEALIKLVGGRERPESGHIQAAFREVGAAKKIVQARAKAKPVS